MILFFLTNFLILSSHYVFLNGLSVTRFSEKTVLVLLFSLTQIFLTQLILGCLHLLYLPLLVLLNVLVSCGFLFSGCRKGGGHLLHLKSDFKKMGQAFFAVLSAENLFLMVLTLLLIIWMGLAAYFLPPRTGDALGYHLPPIFEFIQNHKIFLLPVSQHFMFAFPFTAEMFFMWPAIFFHSTHWLGMVQFIFALIGVIATYAIARELALTRKTSFFVSIQFLFVPVVLAQSGSCYIDIITSSMFLISLFLCLLFFLKGKALSLFSAGVSIGLLVGMKYTTLFLAVTLQVFILPIIFQKKDWKRYAIFLLIVTVLSGYWYGRNLWLLGNPFYPADLTQKGLGIVSAGAGRTFHIENLFFDLVRMGELLFIKDIGLGGLNGGLGSIFWGLAFPSWGYVFTKLFLSLKHKNYKKTKKNLVPILVFGQCLAGFLVFFLVPVENLYLCVRYSIFIIPLALIAFGVVLSLLRRIPLFCTAVKILCCLFAAGSLIHFAGINGPTYAIDYPIQDLLAGQKPARDKYLSYTGYMPPVSYLWEALDFLTADTSGKGLNCYMATDPYFYWPAPTYGTYLQNRVWNLQEGLIPEPSAFIYYFGPLAPVVYHKEKIPLDQVALNPKYELVLSAGEAFLFVEKTYLENEEKKARLAEFYRQKFSETIEASREAVKHFEENVPLLTSSYKGFGFKYYQLIGGMKNPIYLLPGHLLEDFINNNQGSLDIVYTLDGPLEHYSQEVVFKNDFTVIYKNIKADDSTD